MANGQAGRQVSEDGKNEIEEKEEKKKLNEER